MSCSQQSRSGESIYFFTQRDYAFTVGILLECFPCRVRDRIKLLNYGHLGRIAEYPPGAFVFTDFDRLDESEFERVRAFADLVAQSRPGFPILNSPGRVLGRFDLLNQLPEKGLGKTAAHRIDDWQSVTQFPVFLRHERDHRSPITGLIRDRRELEVEVRKRQAERRSESDDTIIVKFLDYADQSGTYRKFGAVKVADQIYGEHLFHSIDWMVKMGDRQSNQAYRNEAQDYYTSNPHAERLQPYFEAAGIDYGRADYCVIDGEINLFEINTNPTLISAPPHKSDAFDRHRFAAMHDDALMSIPVARGEPLKLPNDLRTDGSPLTPTAAHAETLSSLQPVIRRKRKSTRRKHRKQRKQDVISLVKGWMSFARG